VSWVYISAGRRVGQSHSQGRSSYVGPGRQCEKTKGGLKGSQFNRTHPRAGDCHVTRKK